MYKIIITSGYFNPLHIGHLSMFKDARKQCNELIVIVNNDKQQLLKKGKIIIPEKERLEIVKNIKQVSSAYLSIDEDRDVCKSIESLYNKIMKNVSWYDTFMKNIILYFANGGDRIKENIPEIDICNNLGIEMLYGIGGFEKLNSSSEIIEKMEK